MCRDPVVAYREDHKMTKKPDESFDGICSHCREPVTLEDLVMWVNYEPIEMYFVHKIKPEFSENSDGINPNNYFKEMMAQL